MALCICPYRWIWRVCSNPDHRYHVWPRLGVVYCPQCSPVRLQGSLLPLGQREGSMSRGTCGHTKWPEFTSWVPHGRIQHQFLQAVFWPPCVHTNIHSYTHSTYLISSCLYLLSIRIWGVFYYHCFIYFSFNSFNFSTISPDPSTTRLSKSPCSAGYSGTHLLSQHSRGRRLINVRSARDT